MANIKDTSQLRKLRSNHRKLYGEYQEIGPIRAHGKLRPKGVLRLTVDNSRVKEFNIEIPVRDKEQPHFKGFCQAAHTGDVFSIAAWLNPNGTMRFEICNSDGYKPSQPSPQLPF